ncbi:hypothetical protein [Luteimonas sp. R10]|uniref:hypothetical protein n=1 Tax=Luteimonas sp. R10 TaxID=3108176 RepID=UPI00308D27BE|nr:hypothetical protein U3649_05385 [Luteimonas sp. R10]
MSLETITSRYDTAALSDPRLSDLQGRNGAGGSPESEAAQRTGGAGEHLGGRDDTGDEQARLPQSSTPLPATDRGTIQAFMRSSRLAAPLLPPAPQQAPAPQSAVDAGAAMPRVSYNDQSIWLLGKAAQQQNALDAGQARLHMELARALVGPEAGAAPLRLAGSDLAALGFATGASADALRGMHLEAAARYVNTAIDPMHQQDRLRNVLDIAHAAPVMTPPPQPTAAEMKQELRALLGLPEKAFKKMNDGQIAAKYNEVMAALEAGGDFKMKFGKYKVTFSVDGDGQVTACKCKKGGLFGGLFSAIGDFFGKFGKTILGICSFIPIPWIAIPARIVSGVIAVVDGVRSGNVLHAVAGAAGALAGGAGAIAGKLTSSVASGIATVAGKVRDVAHGAQAAIASFQRGGLGGIVNGVLQATSTVSGAFGDVFGGVADAARGVQQWADRVLVGEKVVVDIKNGRIVEAIGGASGLAGAVAGDIGAEGVARVSGQIQQAASHGNDAVETVQAVLRGDVAGALASGADFAAGFDRAFGTHVSLQFDAGQGWLGAAGKWIGHGADALQIGRLVGDGRIGLALASTSELIGEMEWDVALGTVGGRIGLTQAEWDGHRGQVQQTIDVWTGLARDGIRVVRQVRDGDYDGAFDGAIALGNGVAGHVVPGSVLLDPGADWVKSVQRALGYVEEGLAAAGEVRDGDPDGALDRAAALFAGAGIDFGADEGTRGGLILAHLGAWAGFGADGVRIAADVRAQDVAAIAYGALELGIGLGGYVEDAGSVALGDAPAWADEARRRGGDVIDIGLETRRAIAAGDLAATVRAAQELYEAVRAAVARRHDGEAPRAPLARAA